VPAWLNLDAIVSQSTRDRMAAMTEDARKVLAVVVEFNRTWRDALVDYHRQVDDRLDADDDVGDVVHRITGHRRMEDYLLLATHVLTGSSTAGGEPTGQYEKELCEQYADEIDGYQAVYPHMEFSD
jgi:hypothetical protein